MLRMARWGQPAAAGVIPCSPRLTQEGRASLPAPKLAMRSVLDVEHGNDLERARIHHDDLIVDQEHLVAAPVRVDVDDFHRKRVERHLARNTGTDRDREIDVGHRPDVLLLDHGADLGALFGRELCAGAGLSDGLGPAFRALCLGVHVALAVFSAFSLRAGAVLMLFDFSPFMLVSWADLSPFGAALMSSCARWFLAAAGGCSDCVALAPGAGLVGCSDCVAFMPDDGLVGSAASRAAGAAEGAACSDGGALCCAVDPADGASRPIPVPCALANPVPAISAAAATDIIKRLVMEHLLTWFALPAPTTKGDARCSVLSAVPPGLFCECAMNVSP